MSKHKHQIQITDLLAEAVSNAQQRRELGGITELTEEESQNIAGRAAIGKPAIAGGRVILGKIVQPPIIAGGIPIPDLKLSGLTQINI